MDAIALRYLLLGLRLGRHLPGFVDSYYGPAELAEAVDGEPLTPAAELHDEAMQLAGMAAELAGETPEHRRRRWLMAQAGALGALARQVGGEEIGYVDLVEELYDIEVQVEPEATFTAAHRMMHAALPGSAPLRERLATHDREARVPAELVITILSRLADRLRRQTRTQLWLPQHESVQFEEARGFPWEARFRFLGGGRSVVRVNIDRFLTFASAGELAAHESYPGRHAEASVKDELLVAQDHAELSLTAAFTPQALLTEGIASLGREVVMTDQEIAQELQRLAKRLDRRPNIELELAVLRAKRLLLPAFGNAAVALHRDGEPLGQVRAYLAEVALASDELIDSTIARLKDPQLRTQPFAQIEGRRLVAEWLEGHGQTHGFARLLGEQLTPGALRSELAS